MISPKQSRLELGGGKARRTKSVAMVTKIN